MYRVGFNIKSGLSNAERIAFDGVFNDMVALFNDEKGDNSEKTAQKITIDTLSRISKNGINKDFGFKMDHLNIIPDREIAVREILQNHAKAEDWPFTSDGAIKKALDAYLNDVKIELKYDRSSSFERG
jgi:hypothetical protein